MRSTGSATHRPSGFPSRRAAPRIWSGSIGGTDADPACDLIPAWNLLPSSTRGAFREAVDVDDATWARGRGWALAMAVIQLPYFRNTNPIISANARHVIREVLASQCADR